MSRTSPHRIAWVTGAGKGIGRALALRLADEGWLVAASARTEADLLKLAGERPDGRIHAFPCDVTDAGTVTATLERIEEGLGLPDLAVLNAGTHRPFGALDFDLAAFRDLVEVNLMGTVTCLDRLLPRFLARRSGQIAVVASLAGYRGLPSAAGYAASKAALIAMCEALKPELDRHGIRLTLINPGFVRTPLTDQNDFPMPFLISAEQAAEEILRGLRGRRFEIAFPRPFAWLMGLLRILPYPLFFALVRRMVRP